jgi:glycosyltransferase involved in cell wall biosynthesis
MTELICRLDRRIFRVSAACLGDRGALRARVVAADIPIAEFPMRGFAKPRTFAQALHFAAWCRTQGIQLVHACDFYSNVFALPAAALARVPVRLGSRRDVFVPERRAAHRRLQHLSYGAAHAIVTNAGAAADRLVAEGIGRAKIRLIPNGLDAERFSRPRRPSPYPVVTTIANLRPGKGHEVLIEAASTVVAQHPTVRFQIVGDGPRRQALEEQAAGRGLREHVLFVGHCDDVPAMLQRTDVFAFPSLMEASPNAVLEAMAAGVAIAASDAGGIPEVVRHRETGLLVPPGNPAALARAIVELLARPELRARLGESARQAVRSRFSFDRTTADFQALYLSLLSRRARAGAPSPQADVATA